MAEAGGSSKAMTSAQKVVAVSGRGSTQQIPRLSVSFVLAARAGRTERYCAQSLVHHESCRDNVPNVFRNDINRQEIKVAWLIRPDRVAGPDPANVALPSAADCRFDLYAYQAAAGFDHHVLATFSPGFGNPET